MKKSDTILKIDFLTLSQIANKASDDGQKDISDKYDKLADEAWQKLPESVKKELEYSPKKLGEKMG